jgi:hypothetical protein
MLSLLAQESSSGGAAGGAFLFMVFIVAFGLGVLILASWWKIFSKMTQPGWYGIIPIFNYCVIAKKSGKDWWWGLLTVVPCVQIIFQIILLNELSKLFGKGVGYTLGLIFLPFIFFPMLAFGSAEYQGPDGKAF